MKNFLKLGALALGVVALSAVVDQTYAQNTGTNLDLFINTGLCQAQIDSGYYLTGATDFTGHNVELMSAANSRYINDMLGHDYNSTFYWNLSLQTASGLVHSGFAGVAIAPSLINMMVQDGYNSGAASTYVTALNTGTYAIDFAQNAGVLGLLSITDTNGSVFSKGFAVGFQVEIPANQPAGLYNADFEVSLPFNDSLCIVSNIA